MKDLQLFLPILLLGISYAFGASNPDEIESLPGLNFSINFKQYSGYLNASSGKLFHYWFVESQNSPSTDPVLLWLNGGPGCSSLEGFLTELGPFHVKPDSVTLYANPYSWNKIANVIFLESPAGVGFSYSRSKDYRTDDDITSMDNFLALQHFFVKFPQFKKNEFYITGESYGGIYLPTLAVKLLNEWSDINFKGMAIGNGYLEPDTLTNSLFFFSYYHGLIDNDHWGKLTLDCCVGKVSAETCMFAKPPSPDCQNSVTVSMNTVQNSGLNVYNLYADCGRSPSKNSRYAADYKMMFQNLTSASSQNGVTCVDERDVIIANWLNQESVRAALHIPQEVQQWTVCSDEVGMQYKMLYSTMKPQVLQVVKAGKRVLIYNGDVDTVCNFLGDSWFVDSLGLPVINKYKEWHFEDQVAGFNKQFKGLTFLTIKGSGHLVPQDKPGPAYKMIHSFLYNEPY